MESISDYLKEHHPRYRQPTMRKLYEKIRALKATPHLGRPGSVDGTREIYAAGPALKEPAPDPTYRIGTVTDVDLPAWFVAVMLTDCRRCTRSSVLLPFCKTNGMAARNVPPAVCEAEL
jgi:hypothetical protein